MDEGAAVGGAVDPVDRPVEAPAAEVERRPLGFLADPEARLQQPRLEAAGVARRLFAEEAFEQPLDPPRHRPLGRVAADFALGELLAEQGAAALVPEGEGAGAGERVAAGALAI